MSVVYHEEKATLLLLLGHKCVAELYDEPWLREATFEEVGSYKRAHGLTRPGAYECFLDDGNRNRFIMVAILPDAPDVVIEQAREMARLLRF